MPVSFILKISLASSINTCKKKKGPDVTGPIDVYMILDFSYFNGSYTGKELGSSLPSDICKKASSSKAPALP